MLSPGFEKAAVQQQALSEQVQQWGSLLCALNEAEKFCARKRDVIMSLKANPTLQGGCATRQQQASLPLVFPDFEALNFKT